MSVALFVLTFLVSLIFLEFQERQNVTAMQCVFLIIINFTQDSLRNFMTAIFFVIQFSPHLNY